MTDDLERMRATAGASKVAPYRPAGNFGPSGRKQVTINRVMAQVDAAEERRDLRLL